MYLEDSALSPTFGFEALRSSLWEFSCNITYCFVMVHLEVEE